MELYSGSINQFVEDTVQNEVAVKLSAAFFDYFGYIPPDSEVRSWRNSLRAIKDVFTNSGFKDHGVILEYQLPLSSKRLDCIICGRDKDGSDNAVIIELKQWEQCIAGVSDTVITWVVGGNREILHPSAQVGQYKEYLQQNHTAFYETDPIKLDACTYLHNYTLINKDAILSHQFDSWLKRYQLFSGGDVNKLSSFLKRKLELGNGLPVMERIQKSKYGPSKKLLQQISKVIKNNERYILLDEQLVAFDKVMTLVKHGLKNKQKSVVIIKGGPGTGKSVIAINLLAELSRLGFNAQYATGSRAFTQTLRKTIGKGGPEQVKYFNTYINAEPDMIDVLVADESHRIRVSSNNMYTPRVKRSNLPQVEELIRVAKVPVFFIDDRQIVRPGEIGSANYIKENAERLGCKVHEYQLDIQFRCQGSDKFVQWINNTLGIIKTAEAIWDSKNTDFDFQIVNSPQELYRKIKEKNDQEPNSARLVAGFCWKWSQANLDGTLVKDVVIDDFAMTWEGKETGRKLAKDVPPASLWPYDPRAVDQIGSIYTIQGFEFDYVGVIIGKDLMYNFETNQWEGHPENSSDSVVKRAGDKFIDLAKNAYRVLLSRALKGCYVYFVDKDTEKFVKSRITLIC
ncbi:DUF2075 domain-containing protein [Patescibacteria group bacterium]|nr:DUF2075 domain-containing protein [Patescibacteria group bacterium]